MRLALILGQRRTALVAKQAAEIDVLGGGHLRLKVGEGYKHIPQVLIEAELCDPRAGSRQRRSVGWRWRRRVPDQIAYQSSSAVSVS